MNSHAFQGKIWGQSLTHIVVDWIHIDTMTWSMLHQSSPKHYFLIFLSLLWPDIVRCRLRGRDRSVKYIHIALAWIQKDVMLTIIPPHLHRQRSWCCHGVYINCHNYVKTLTDRHSVSGLSQLLFRLCPTRIKSHSPQYCMKWSTHGHIYMTRTEHAWIYMGRYNVVTIFNVVSVFNGNFWPEISYCCQEKSSMNILIQPDIDILKTLLTLLVIFKKNEWWQFYI